MKRPPRKPLTAEQKKDAARLRALWEHRPEPKLSQDEAANKWEIGTTQGAIEQYLNARIPLNLRVAMKFARGLRCRVADFSPSLATEIAEITAFGILEERPGPSSKRWNS